ncbi:ComEC/Rec2 family competence protein [Arthrobacter sp. A5]|uniref:ComEC/Rec2 family competence protein n=1 Tax=Arthrobacter sp. A5 TaxID=576926 RepID=UPI003DA9A3A1
MTKDRARPDDAAAEPEAPKAAKQPWQRYLQAAVGSGPRTDLPDEAIRPPVPSARSIRRPAWRSPELVRRFAARARAGAPGGRQNDGGPGTPGALRRIDMRLVPATVCSWTAALAGTAMPATDAVRAGLVACLLGPAIWVGARMALAPGRSRRRSRTRKPRQSGLLRAIPAAVLALLCVAGVLLVAGAQAGFKTRGPIGQAITGSVTVTAVLLVRADPHPVSGPASGGKVIVEALLTEATSGGLRFEAAAPVLVVGGADWDTVVTGQYVAAAGTLKATDAGADTVAYFAAKSAPRVIAVQQGWTRWAAELRAGWRAAAQSLSGTVLPDAAGLLPGMITGDRSAQPADLDAAMKQVGLTHLTAVSGANCTLILGGLIYLARCVRCPRWLAAGLAVTGLAGFVAVVGPDPSVLRAALMGVIGILAMLSGRPKRVSALLAVAVVGLLLVDPWLAVNYAFILSVLATLGLLLVGKQCSRWLLAWFPHWLAQAVAVPLTAQLFCAPVIVLLQPQLMAYSLPANMAAAPVIALVTGIGTLGLVALALAPWAVPALVFLSGIGAQWVAFVARFFSGLPGAAQPWPEGVAGVTSMAGLSAVTVAGLWGTVHHRRIAATALRLRARLPPRWRGAAGLPGGVALASVTGAVLAWLLNTAGAH